MFKHHESFVLFNHVPYMRGYVRDIGGRQYTFIEVGPSVAVLPIRRVDGVIELMLIEEMREEVAGFVVKAAGGFLRGRPWLSAAREILAQEAGVTCARLVQLTPFMTGLTVIAMPIAVYLGLDWSHLRPITATRIIWTLEEAVDAALAHRFADQCTDDAVLRIAVLESRGNLPL
jgi:hypothetical protein